MDGGRVDSGVGTDMPCNGGLLDTTAFQDSIPQFQQGLPGPSGLACAGTLPCP